ncbi:MAG: pyruvate dehydrogenase (acetyl-transferring) E1 component subunit alpha [Fimbriimonadia bacterium]|nr:pyruvate dehydrogenase (acetyl-transferring) E1 component subunit alpha [Fimbriimonadia bacterium]
MLLIRRFEEQCNVAYRQAKIGGYLHLYIGQEAVAVGFISQLQKQDRVVGHYRDHGYVLALGSDPKAVMAELLGKETGLCKGKGGSMHLYDRDKNFLGGYGIIGGMIGIATGVAFKQRYMQEDGVTLCFFGDGSMNAGLLHECFNMAGLWDLPVIYIVENNKYAMGTALEHHSSETNLAKRASVYGFPSKQIDGMDVLSVRAEAREVIKHVREKREPYFVEAITYRFVGHGAADITDPGSYRTKEELEEWKERDPLESLKAILVGDGVISESELQTMDDEIKAIVKEAARFADESADPPPDALFEDVLA